MTGGVATAGKLYLYKKKKELDPNFLMFWGGEYFGKVVEHKKGARKKLQYLHANIPNRRRGGHTCLNIPNKI